MTIASVITKTGVMGAYKVAWGTFTVSGGATGGNIDTGLTLVHSMYLQTGGAAVSADQSSINETLPCDGSAVTIVTTANTVGTWFAIGK